MSEFKMYAVDDDSEIISLTLEEGITEKRMHKVAKELQNDGVRADQILVAPSESLDYVANLGVDMTDFDAVTEALFADNSLAWYGALRVYTPRFTLILA